MPTLSTVLRQALRMTERDALVAYESHIRMCGQCAVRRQAACKRGVQLHDAWKREEARQNARPAAGAARR